MGHEADLVGAWECRASILVEGPGGELTPSDSTTSIPGEEDFLFIRTLDGTDLVSLRFAAHFDVERILLSTSEWCERQREDAGSAPCSTSARGCRAR